MANETKQIYYKVISIPSMFWSAYSSQIQYGTTYTDLNIQYGTEYVANAPNITKAYMGIKQPVLHFAEGAFDTMLWHSILIWDYNKHHTIYEIEPMTPIIKERCMDGTGIYQCGAQKIKILSPVNLDEMYERAMAEFHQNRKVQIEKYPNLDISKIIAAWVQHEQSKYLKNK